MLFQHSWSWPHPPRTHLLVKLTPHSVSSSLTLSWLFHLLPSGRCSSLQYCPDHQYPSPQPFFTYPCPHLKCKDLGTNPTFFLAQAHLPCKLSITKLNGWGVASEIPHGCQEKRKVKCDKSLSNPLLWKKPLKEQQPLFKLFSSASRVTWVIGSRNILKAFWKDWRVSKSHWPGWIEGEGWWTELLRALKLYGSKIHGVYGLRVMWLKEQTS